MCPHPIIDGLLLHFENLGNINDIRVSRVDGQLFQQIALAEQAGVEFVLDTHQFIKQSFLPYIFCMVF